MNRVTITFLGDISIANPITQKLPVFDFLKHSDIVIANLEGPIVSENKISQLNKKTKRVLYNSPDIIDVLETFRVDIVCLANNHIYDCGNSLRLTKELLENSEIGYFGAGDNLNEAEQPYVINSAWGQIKLFGFGWDVIGCQYATKKRPGVNPFESAHLLRTIRDLRKRDKDSTVIYYLHWNYELEGFPQPADRQFSEILTNEGVDAIIGLHPHVPQGAEFYRGKPVVYSLGNWFFPARQFGPLQLSFSSISSRQLALELDIVEREVVSTRFHWCQFNDTDNSITYEKNEDKKGEILESLTPYRDMQHSAYINWFKKNRIQRSGLPIYKNYSAHLANFIKDQFVKLRQFFIWKLVELRLKK